VGLYGSDSICELLAKEEVAFNARFSLSSVFFYRFFSFYSAIHYLFKFFHTLSLKFLSSSLRIIFFISSSFIAGKSSYFI